MKCHNPSSSTAGGNGDLLVQNWNRLGFWTTFLIYLLFRSFLCFNILSHRIMRFSAMFKRYVLQLFATIIPNFSNWTIWTRIQNSTVISPISSANLKIHRYACFLCVKLTSKFRWISEHWVDCCLKTRYAWIGNKFRRTSDNSSSKTVLRPSTKNRPCYELQAVSS